MKSEKCYRKNENLAPEQRAIEAKQRYHIDKDSTDKDTSAGAFDSYMDALDGIQNQHHSHTPENNQ